MRLGWVVSVVLLFIAIQIKASIGCLDKERKGLLQIKAQFVAFWGNYTEKELRSWVEEESSDCCNWERVKCSDISSTPRHITDLSLGFLIDTSLLIDLLSESNRMLKESNRILNVSLFSPFQELQSLNLSYNGFGGWSNNEGFSRIKKLEILDLSVNRLDMDIRLLISSLNQSTLLRTLNLHYSGLSGSLFAQDLDNFIQLEKLDLSFNSLGGSLLAEDFLNLKSLKWLDLSFNEFNGSVQGLCTMKGIMELDLNNNMFNGQLPECLGNLTNLNRLDLSNNQFTGNFPSFIPNLTSLEYLSLYENDLQGSFSLNNLANNSKLESLTISSRSPGAQVETESVEWFPKFQLKYLTIQNCNLNKDQGSVIPSFLRYQHDLQEVDLSHNKMVGEFPNWLMHNNSMIFLSLRNNSFEGNLKLSSVEKDISYLDISNNNVSGLLPKNIGIVLPFITHLNLSFNNFEGNIPVSICEMRSIIDMDLSHNHFSSELPQNLAITWTDLSFLKLSNNFFQGNIPSFLNNKLSYLYLNNNNFNGTLKDVLPNNTGMSVLDISNNSIHGEIPSLIGNYDSMQILLMAQNQLEGEISNVFYSMPDLEILDLSENKLSGPISHFNLSSLRFLYLQKNALSGSVPFSLSKCSKLQTLDLRDNKFSGNVPYWMDKLSELRVLLLGNNTFKGRIPIELCKLRKIIIMDLSNNIIDGSIPSCFSKLSFRFLPTDDDDHLVQFDRRSYSSISSYNYPIFIDKATIEVMNEELVTVEFRTKNNYYSYRGSILDNMTGLDLSCNKLSGTIPSQIGNLQNIRAMNLSHNHLSGSIPKSFSNLTQIESLDLSFNKLSGEIPPELIKLNSVSIFNVSYNNLSGTPPSTRQFGTFVEDSYKGNPYLCGSFLEHKCKSSGALPSSESSDTEEKEAMLDMEAFYWSFTATCITIQLVFIAVLCINPYWRMTWFYFIGKVINKCFSPFPLY